MTTNAIKELTGSMFGIASIMEEWFIWVYSDPANMERTNFDILRSRMNLPRRDGK